MLHILVKVHFSSRGFHLAYTGSLAAMSQHVQSRGPAGEDRASVSIKTLKKKKKKEEEEK